MRTTRNIGCGLGAIIIAAMMMQGAWAADIEMSGNVSVSGTLSATAVAGDGSGLTNIPGGAISNTSITVNQLANGSVTSAKIAFFSSMAVVATSGGHYVDPVSAMASLSSWCSNPCAYPDYNHCVLKIMPGVYNIGSNPLQMHDCVDIEGSGETNTKITGRISSTTSGVVRGAQAELRSLTVWNDHWQIAGGTDAIAIYNNEHWFYIKNVSVMSRGAVNNYGVYGASGSYTFMENVTADARIGTDAAYGIYNNMGSLSMKNVYANAEQAPYAYGIYLHTSDNWIPSVEMNKGYVRGAGDTRSYGIYNRNLSVTIKDVEIDSELGSLYNYGIFNEQTVANSPMTIINVNIDAHSGQGFGILNASTGGPITVDHSIIKGSTNTVRNDNGSTTFRVGASKLDGAGVAAGALTCVGTYNGNYVALGTNCQP